MTTPTLEALALRDRDLEVKASRSSLALMEHRWQVINVHGYSAAAYAKAIGRDASLVRKYALGWQHWQERTSDVLSPNDALELGRMSVEKAEAHEIVAEAKGLPISQVRRQMPHVAREVQHQIADQVAAGKPREEAVDFAKKLAAGREDIARNRAKNAEREPERPFAAFAQIIDSLTQMNRGLKDAILLARESPLSEEHSDLIAQMSARVRERLDLFDVAVAGRAEAIDWDSAAAGILSD